MHRHRDRHIRQDEMRIVSRRTTLSMPSTGLVVAGLLLVLERSYIVLSRLFTRGELIDTIHHDSSTAVLRATSMREIYEGCHIKSQCQRIISIRPYQ